jgi:hypothetical protein
MQYPKRLKDERGCAPRGEQQEQPGHTGGKQLGGRLIQDLRLQQRVPHTLGNALRTMLLPNPQVLFAGYTIPHSPL